MTHIRIVQTPPGEAPRKIREAWIGVTVPLAPVDAPQPSVWAVEGVLGKEYTFWAKVKKSFGVPPAEQPHLAYVVNALDAVSALSERSPAAAAWWKANTPHLMAPGVQLCFAAHCCAEVAGCAA